MPAATARELLTASAALGATPFCCDACAITVIPSARRGDVSPPRIERLKTDWHRRVSRGAA
jgi:hypothetical protein